jgi:peptidyl-tRNA hydrolase
VKSQEYSRLRIGIAPEDPARRGELRDYVLDDFGKHEATVVRGLFPTLTEALEVWIKDGIVPVMNRFTGGGESPT